MKKRNITQTSKKVALVLNGPAPDKTVVRSNKDNNKLLIVLLVYALKDITITNRDRRLIVTGPDPVPIEVSIAGCKARDDLTTLHDEADTIIVSKMLCMVNEGYKLVEVICDDTDVFVLLLHHLKINNLRHSLLP